MNTAPPAPGSAAALFAAVFSHAPHAARAAAAHVHDSFRDAMDHVDALRARPPSWHALAAGALAGGSAWIADRAPVSAMSLTAMGAGVSALAVRETLAKRGAMSEWRTVLGESVRAVEAREGRKVGAARVLALWCDARETAPRVARGVAGSWVTRAAVQWVPGARTVRTGRAMVRGAVYVRALEREVERACAAREVVSQWGAPANTNAESVRDAA